MADRRDIEINLLGRETVSPAATRAGRAVDDLGDDMRSTAADARKLDDQIGDLERSLAGLAAQYARTGNDDFIKRIRDQERELRKVKKARGLLGHLLPDPAEAGDEASALGVSMGARIAQSLSKGVASVGPGAAIGAPIVAGVVAWLGGVAAGGLLATAAVGAVAGGVMIAARDPQVRAAASSLGESIGDQLKDAAKPFVPATIGAIDAVRDEFQLMADDFEGIFAKGAQFVEPLARAVSGLVREMLPGMRAAVEAAAPVISILEQKLPQLGAQLGDLFGTMADNATEGAMAVGLLFDVIGMGIKLLGGTISTLATVFKWADLIASAMIHNYERILDYATAEAKASEEGTVWAEKLKELIGGLSGADDEVQSLIGSLDELQARNLGLAEAELAAERAIDSATASIKENGESTDLNRKAGQDNRAALLDMARAFNQSAAAMDASNISSTQASEAYQRNRNALIRAAEAAGHTRAEARLLADQWLQVPKNVETTVTARTGQAAASLAVIKRTLDSLKDKTVNVYVAAYNKNAYDTSEVPRRAHGGPIDGPGPKGVDSELILAAPGEHVLTAREVDAAGGHGAVVRWRKSLLGQSDRAGVMASHPALATGSPGSTPAPPGLSPAQLAAAIRAALIGVTVQMDGRTVGRIQGREADIYSRI